MMRHEIGDVEQEPFEQRAQRIAFEAWMKENYPGMHFNVEPTTGYYTPAEVNACWEIWLYKTRG